MMYTKEQAKQTVKNMNQVIDDYMEKGIVEDLEKEGVKVVDGKIPIDKWFLAQRLINEKGFYYMAKAVQDLLRADGWDVKMNMQTNKLVF